MRKPLCDIGKMDLWGKKSNENRQLKSGLHGIRFMFDLLVNFCCVKYAGLKILNRFTLKAIWVIFSATMCIGNLPCKLCYYLF